MENKIVLKKIAVLELMSGFIATMAPVISVMISFNSKMQVLIILSAIAISFQPFIYFQYKKIGQLDLFFKKRFWPLVMGLILILFLVLINYFNWKLY